MIQARISSSRLPGKVMKPLVGKPMIGHILESLSNSKRISDIIVVTSTNKQDDVLVNYLKENNWKYFRGDENDVLSRYYKAAEKYDADYIVRITADNPLIDHDIVDEVIEKAIERNVDYAANDLIKTYPQGYRVEIISRKTLKEIESIARDNLSREHVTLYVINNKSKYNVLNVSAPKSLRYPDWRLTVDTKEDFNLIEKIFESLYLKNKSIKYKDVVKFLLKNSDLLKINKNVRQVQV